MGPEKQLGQVPAGLVVIQPEGAGGLLAPGGRVSYTWM
jgi:hypothetical protein